MAKKPESENPAENPAVEPQDDMAAKRKFHPQADQKNKIALRKGHPVLTCGAKKSEKRGGGFCKSIAGFGTQHPGYGRCKFCGGNNTGPKSKAHLKAGVNGRKLGLYSESLSVEEREVYENGLEEQRLDLEHEILLLKAKIVTYLRKWRRRYDKYYADKEAEQWLTYECPACGEQYGGSSLDKVPYRSVCFAEACKAVERKERDPLRIVEALSIEPTPYECERYAEDMTRVYYSDGEGRRSYYNAGDLNDRSLDKALQTLARLVRNHALLNVQTSENLLDTVNAELRQASKGRVEISWGGQPQHYAGDPKEGQDGNGE